MTVMDLQVRAMRLARDGVKPDTSGYRSSRASFAPTGARRDRDLLGIPHVLHSRRLRSRTGESPLADRSILDRIKHQMQR
jgi:hypothetical protein